MPFGHSEYQAQSFHESFFPARPWLPALQKCCPCSYTENMFVITANVVEHVSLLIPAGPGKAHKPVMGGSSASLELNPPSPAWRLSSSATLACLPFPEKLRSCLLPPCRPQPGPSFLTCTPHQCSCELSRIYIFKQSPMFRF